MSKPLRQLLMHDASFESTAECQSAFEKLKKFSQLVPQFNNL